MSLCGEGAHHKSKQGRSLQRRGTRSVDIQQTWRFSALLHSTEITLFLQNCSINIPVKQLGRSELRRFRFSLSILVNIHPGEELIGEGGRQDGRLVLTVQGLSSPESGGNSGHRRTKGSGHRQEKHPVDHQQKFGRNSKVNASRAMTLMCVHTRHPCGPGGGLSFAGDR